jgi:hypothetical protein
MDTARSVCLQHASFKFTMCRSCHISYSQRIPLLLYRSQISRKDNGDSSCENSKTGNKSFPAIRNETMSHRLCLLPVTGIYISELIILMILKSGSRRRCCYTSERVESYVTTDGQAASLSWCEAPIWGLRQDFYCWQTIVGLLIWAPSLTRG